MTTFQSRIPGFYKYTLEERLDKIASETGLDATEIELLRQHGGLSIADANHMIENAIGVYNLPLGIGTNFQINGDDYLIPMVIEEPSVVAAVSNAAKLFRSGGGFETASDEPVMIGQIQVLDTKNPADAVEKIANEEEILLQKANNVGGSIVERGGGARKITTRIVENSRVGNMIIVHLHYDTRDAMGANAINTAVEHIAPDVEQITGGRTNLRILSNLSDERKAYAKGIITKDALSSDDITGDDVIKQIIEASVFAEIDPYRATTHNKGIMNGIDAVAIATGNDWRAIEAGAHAYAARHGTYTSLTTWQQGEDGNLYGSIELPLAVGTVGGATRVHPIAQIALKILRNPSARKLAEIMAAVGLAQNLGAIRALATEGIQQGHMRMHARQMAAAAGASTEQIARVVKQLIDEDNIRLRRAKEIVQQINSEEG